MNRYFLKKIHGDSWTHYFVDTESSSLNFKPQESCSSPLHCWPPHHLPWSPKRGWWPRLISPKTNFLGLAAHFRSLSQGQGPFSLSSSSFREGLVDFTERITLKSLCPGWITSPVADKIVSSSKVSSIPPLPLSAPPSSPWASCCPRYSSPSSTELWGEVS